MMFCKFVKVKIDIDHLIIECQHINSPCFSSWTSKDNIMCLRVSEHNKVTDTVQVCGLLLLNEYSLICSQVNPELYC